MNENELPFKRQPKNLENIIQERGSNFGPLMTHQADKTLNVEKKNGVRVKIFLAICNILI